MTAITDLTPPSLSAITSSDLENSVHAVLGALGQKSTAKLSEATLYASLVHYELNKMSTPLAGGMLKELPGISKKLTSPGKDPNPLLTGVTQYLNKLANHKKISTPQADQIRKSALGHAQLDSSRTRVNTKATTAQSSLLAKVTKNKNLTAAEDKRVTFLAKEDRVAAGARTDALIKKFVESPLVQVKAAATPPPSTPKPAGTSETVVHAQTPKPEQQTTTPLDWVYKPHSETDGKAWFYVPTPYADLVQKVTFVSSVDEKTEELLFRGTVKDDGRAVWSSSKRGIDFGAVRILVRYTFQDGSHLDQATLDPREYRDRGMGGL